VGSRGQIHEKHVVTQGFKFHKQSARVQVGDFIAKALIIDLIENLNI